MLANCSGRPITRVSVAAESFLLRLSPSGLSALQMAYHRSLDGYYESYQRFNITSWKAKPVLLSSQGGTKGFKPNSTQN